MTFRNAMVVNRQVTVNGKVHRYTDADIAEIITYGLGPDAYKHGNIRDWLADNP